MKESVYYKQARLLLTLLPWLQAEKDVCLKGGTAINFFYRNLPRLSVDIDLTYLPIQNRDESLACITRLMERYANHIRKMPGIHVIPKKQDVGATSSLIVRKEPVQVKVEVNTVLRGTVYPCNTLKLCKAGEELFQLTTNALVMSIADLYGGKICAALDRQNPRDLFDVMLLMENEGITDGIRQAFVVYLVSHSRPMAELLEPNLLDIEPVFVNEFQGMTVKPVKLKDLLVAREALIRYIDTELTENERRFILSVKDGNPLWNLMPVPGLETLPGIQWKLMNLERMEPTKHNEAVKKLKRCLQL